MISCSQLSVEDPGRMIHKSWHLVIRQKKIFIVRLSVCLLRLDSPDLNTARVKGTEPRISGKNDIVTPKAVIPNASPRANA